MAVAIPTKNRPEYLAALLTSLADQTFSDWMLVINDSSDVPVEQHAAIRDLLGLLTSHGHPVQTIRTHTGWDRHQRAMQALPPEVELILRVDDDVTLTPRFLDDVQKPFRFFADRPVAAVGGCTPETHLKALDLDVQLIQPVGTDVGRSQLAVVEPLHQPRCSKSRSPGHAIIGLGGRGGRRLGRSGLLRSCLPRRDRYLHAAASGRIRTAGHDRGAGLASL
jgi:hypothetical protein